jgi:hypothetical protein
VSRRLWVFAGALIVFGLLLGVVVHDVGRRGAFAGRYSAWSALPDGARAALLTLERSGVPTTRRTQDLVDLDMADALLVLGPTRRIAKHETDAILAWTDKGRTILLFPESDSNLLSALGVSFTRAAGGPEASPLSLFLDDDEDEGGKGKKDKGKGKDKAANEEKADGEKRTPSSQPDGDKETSSSQPDSEKKTPSSQPAGLKDPYEIADKVPPERLLPAQPSELLAGVSEVEAIVAGTLRPTNADVDFVPLLVDEKGRTVGAVVGRKDGGRAVIIAAPDLFANRRLAARDNAMLLHALGETALSGAATPPKPGARRKGPAADVPRRLEFDEFHHGFTGTRTVVGYIWRGDLKWVLLQLLFLGLLALARTWKRFGPAAEPPEASQTARDYLQAMARIYRLGGHRAAAADRVWGYARRRIAARLGLSGKIADGAGAANEIEAIGLAQLARLYRRAEAARTELQGSATDGDLLDFGRAVAAVEAEAQRGRARRTPPRGERAVGGSSRGSAAGGGTGTSPPHQREVS